MSDTKDEVMGVCLGCNKVMSWWECQQLEHRKKCPKPDAGFQPMEDDR